MVDEPKLTEETRANELDLSEEVRWLKSQNLRLFDYLRESMNKIRPAYVGTYPPTECGIATFTKDVVMSVAKFTPFSRPSVIAVSREQETEAYERRVKFKLMQNRRQSYLDAATYVNNSSIDVVSVQHEYGIYGGDDGEYILDFVEALKKPVVVTLHTVLQNPSPNQKRIIQEFARLAGCLVVMVGVGERILNEVYGVSSEKIRIIPHGVPNVKMVSSSAAKNGLGYGGRYVMSTFGLLSRGKGIEDAIKAMPAIVEKIPNAAYLILGETHPGVRKHEGESYRNSLIELVHSLGMEEHVSFNNRYLALPQLIRYLSATDVYITPYLGKDQITSGTLAYALGCGKAIVSTPYLYAEETLSEGRGCLVDFRSPDQIAEAVSRILTDKPFRKSLETEAYSYGRRTTWFNVAVEYLDMFYHVCKSS